MSIAATPGTPKQEDTARESGDMGIYTPVNLEARSTQISIITPKIIILKALLKGFFFFAIP